MPKRRPQPDQQSLLPAFAEREAERRALVRGALEKLVLAKRIKRQVAWELEVLILYLDQYDDGNGCGAFAATLARVPRRAGQPPMAGRTLERRMDALRALALIESWWSGPGRRRHRVRWDTLKALARQTNTPQASSLKPQACPKKVADYSAKVADYSAKVADYSAKVADLYNKELYQIHIPETLSPLPPSPANSAPAACAWPAPAGDRRSLRWDTVSKSNREEEGFFNQGSGVGARKLGGIREVEGDLRACGVFAIDQVHRAVRERGLSLAFVHAAVRHWQDQQPAWSPAAILICLRRAAPGDDPQDPRLWPPKSPAAQRAARAEISAEVSAKREAEQLATRREADLDRRAAVDRERRLGEQLDQLSAAKFSQLASRLPAAYQKMFARDLVQRAHGEPITNALVREQLLLLLDSSSMEVYHS